MRKILDYLNRTFGWFFILPHEYQYHQRMSVLLDNGKPYDIILIDKEQ